MMTNRKERDRNPLGAKPVPVGTDPRPLELDCEKRKPAFDDPLETDIESLYKKGCFRIYCCFRISKVLLSKKNEQLFSSLLTGGFTEIFQDFI
ncbi:hypothetical protein D3H55_22460 [Bacillus salacetis]|uniref:Uncharacterized protein n=1 Tax=Bacillus salacetis TaxID=2315464 RepID=A0A3A1QN15_9BACI|nr:hypothetical protein D3H55_22460 [Bacillus salacetis]